MTASKHITKYLFALTVSTHPVLPPPPPLHLLLYLLPSISPFSSCSSSSQLHVTISKTSVKVVLDCASVGEKAVSAAGNITTDGVEVLGRTVRSRGRRDNSAPVSLSHEPQGAPLNGGALIAATRTTHWLTIMKVRTALQQSASLSYQAATRCSSRRR